MPPPLDKQVLRYWLASVRTEEALAARPRARRSPARPGPVHVELQQPVEGAEYLRVAADLPMWQVAAGAGELQLPMDAAAAAFFETWLSRQYRGGPTTRVKRGAKAEREDEERIKHLLCFPVVHLPRDELAGLLRCEVRVDFVSPDGRVFAPPSPNQRRAGDLPPAPTDVRLMGLDAAPPSEGRLPFFVDTRLLHEELGVQPQEIDAFFGELGEVRGEEDAVAPARMLAALCALLSPVAGGPEADGPAPMVGRLGQGGPAASAVAAVERGEEPSPADIEALLQLLVQRMNARLAQRRGKAKAYAMGIVMDGQRARSTWHLQRELQLLIEEPDDGGAERPALHAYLTGERPAQGLSPTRAAYPGKPLTESQRAAAEHFLGSTLSAVQGPPGTGKTTVILHLAAEHIAQQVDALVDRGRMGYGLMLVASTNNRAVDNVIEALNLDPALAGGGGLPLALRTGSRQVCEQITTRQIRDATRWLQRHMGGGQAAEHQAQAALDDAIERYKTLRAELQQAQSGRIAQLQQGTQRMASAARLAEIDRELAGRGGDPVALAVQITDADLDPIKPIAAALDRLSNLASASVSQTALRRIGRAYAKYEAQFEAVRGLEARLLDAGPWPLPPKPRDPSPEAVMEAWEDAVEATVARVEALLRLAADAVAQRQLHAERARLDAALRASGADAVVEAVGPGADRKTDPDPAAALDPLREALFTAALAVRQAWAVVHAQPLHDALQVAAKCVATERSMRTLFRAEDEAGRWLRRLCGVWGCTLLSAANAVPAESRAVARAIIDEAGQCHPAHAVSALMRCERALVIGDVHQLQPVVGLGQQDEGRVRAQARITLSDAQLGPYRVYEDGDSSVQSLADRALGEPLRLTDHFRCQPAIIALSDAFCRYGLQVHTPPRSRAAEAPFLRGPLLFGHVDGEQQRLGGSWVNHAELQACMRLLDSLLAAGIGADDIAIITPYRAQLELLQRGAAQRGIRMARGLRPEDQLSLFGGPSDPGGLTLGTVHRFQGGERSIVLFSSVVTRTAQLGFLNQRPNLLNVTVSRAREHLVTLGHAETLAAGALTRRLAAGCDVVALG